MKWSLRGLLLVAILLVTVSFLYLPQWRAPVVYQGSQKYFTWDNPDFAYFNNQFLLHLSSAVKNPLPARRLLSPGITCPAVRGVDKSHLIPVTDVFDASGLEQLGYDTRPQVATNLHDAPTLVVNYTRQIAEAQEQVVRITAPTESYWQRSAFGFVRDAFILPFRAAPWRKAAQLFTLSTPLDACVNDMLPDILPKALALHIRTWPSDLSFGQKDPCHQNEVPVLRNVFGKCEWTGSYLYDNVKRAQLNSEQPVVIATDDREGEIVRDLVKRLDGRARFMEMTDKCKEIVKQAHPEAEFEWRLATYWPIIEATALTRAESFVGSFWSTLSQLVAIRRSEKRTFFFQTRSQALIWDLRVPGGMLLLVGMIYVGYSYCRHILVNRRKRLAATVKSEVMVSP
ncbi:uncharacterized protein PADG_04041 [Paracoccidioides brasiliensis Pb18]|uniref:Uncharacterized protein n=2 Tax=Paracoccidioides brasiliensis TaxID=121759 RepID=C1G9V5_PARBD|nr:uncharacterized protein PADG_04041 [Paracoccidioides brasiliensis Pb18]EEH47957.1 hypothetical protein PADG_04041 [Paracoccidioides brasiliensis Pb18]ODH21705.1 hypothetical protein ACO22_05628 [Paracoccidioides brasiliensis]ODH50925.1 hypothetical protein GX48_02885 [Paracoccidioides brasiliensis]